MIDRVRRRRAVRHGGELEKISASATGFDVPAPQLNDADPVSAASKLLEVGNSL